jgi:carboxymethylenebutenolidase
MEPWRAKIQQMRTPLLVLAFTLLASALLLSAADIVTFPSGDLTLQGVLYRPDGNGPFPAILYNHGSAAGMLSNQAFDALGPVFTRHGWVFFGPYRRGQGLSASAGPFIGDEIAPAEKKGGIAGGAQRMVQLLETDHLVDQLVRWRGCENRHSFNSIALLLPGTHLAASKRYSGPSTGTTAPRSILREALRAGRRRFPCNRG